MTDTSFINYLKNITQNKHLISLWQTFCTMTRSGLETLPELMAKIFTLLIESIKTLLVIILGVSVILFGIIWAITTLLLIISLQLLEDNIHLSSNFSYPKELVMKLLAYLKPYWDSLNAGIDKLLKK